MCSKSERRKVASSKLVSALLPSERRHHVPIPNLAATPGKYQTLKRLQSVSDMALENDTEQTHGLHGEFGNR